MATYSIEELLTDVNLVAEQASVETLRPGVTKDILHVYRTIDAESLFQPGIAVINPTPYSNADLPPLFIKLVDVRTALPEFFDRGFSGFVNRSGQFVTGTRFLGYKIHGDKIYFDEGRLTEPLVLTYWQVPTDPNGAPAIQDIAWKAVQTYCQAEAARLNLNKKNKQSFSGLPYQVNLQVAKSEMDAARAHANALAKPDFINLYQSLHPMGYVNPIGSYGGRSY